MSKLTANLSPELVETASNTSNNRFLLQDAHLVAVETQLRGNGIVKWDMLPDASDCFTVIYSTDCGDFYTPNTRLLGFSNLVAFDDTYKRAIIVESGLTGVIEQVEIRLGTTAHINREISRSPVANSSRLLIKQELYSELYDTFTWTDKPMLQHQYTASMFVPGGTFDLINTKQALEQSKKKKALEERDAQKRDDEAQWFELEQQIARIRNKGKNKTAWLF